jgi:threonine synthase
MKVICPDCGHAEHLSPDGWRCACGGMWEPEMRTPFDWTQVDRDDHSHWRYLGLYGLDFESPQANLGAGGTPLLPASWHGRQVFFKMEYVAPTGSFKDRGMAIIVNVLAHQGVSHIVEDSSGNAGASMAAYAARAGINADIFVPTHASPAKKGQIAIYGASVHAIPGPRSNSQKAAVQAIGKGRVFASHASHPGYLVGMQSVAWEVWEQLGHRAPDWFVVPVGQGGHLLGVWLGFRRLQLAGLTGQMPKLIAVQSCSLAPVCQAFDDGLEAVPCLEPDSTSIAEGILISQPVRGRRILQALRDTGGGCIKVSDEAISAAQNGLAMQGFHVEATSATAAAALEDVFARAAPDKTIVVPLTGSGLKGGAT